MASNEMKFRVEGVGGNTQWPHHDQGGVNVINRNHHPIEVTVRRVPEKVVLDGAWQMGALSVGWGKVQDQLEAAGYFRGQRVKVTVEPLD